MNLSRCIAFHRPRPAARSRLFCLPYAGGGASVYRGWQERLPHDVEVVPLQLRGRESRFAEPPLRHVAPIVAELVEAVAPMVVTRPWALFGHSMGGLLAFELARALRRLGLPRPTHLFVAACPAPQLAAGPQRRHELSDDEFRAEIARIGGTTPEILADDELMNLLLPRLRADFAVCDDYGYVHEHPLDCPITVMAGHDDAAVTREQVEGWSAQTGRSFSLHWFPGDHFFTRSQATGVMQLLARELRPAATSAAM